MIATKPNRRWDPKEVVGSGERVEAQRADSGRRLRFDGRQMLLAVAEGWIVGIRINIACINAAAHIVGALLEYWKRGRSFWLLPSHTGPEMSYHIDRVFDESKRCLEIFAQ